MTKFPDLTRHLERVDLAMLAPAVPVAPVPVSLDLITHMDRVLAKGEQNARKNADREAGYKAAAQARRYASKTGNAQQAGLFEEVG